GGVGDASMSTDASTSRDLSSVADASMQQDAGVSNDLSSTSHDALDVDMLLAEYDLNGVDLYGVDLQGADLAVLAQKGAQDVSGGGCSCRVSGAEDPSLALGAIVGLGMLALALRRRRRV